MATPRLPSLAIALVLAGCGVAPAPTATHAPAGGAATRALLQAAPTETWAWEPREDAPWATFPRGDRPPAGPAIHLDFRVHPGGTPPGDHQVYYADGVPFAVRLVAGAAFAVLDRDATDGEATVAFPPGAHDGWLARLGEPGGTLAATDALFFRREVLSMDRGRRDWVRLGARAVPNPHEALRGPDVLRFEARGLTGFATRWPAGVADVPPLPPLLVDLVAPAELLAGTGADVRALVAGGHALPPDAAFVWGTTDPDGRVAAATTTDGTVLPWLAPAAPGRYLVDLAVETPWFRAQAPAPRPIRVRRELFLDTAAPPAKPWADHAIAAAEDTWPLTAGVAFDLTVEGTMNNYGGGTTFCGAPEPAPWWETAGKVNGLVNVDPAFFFANLPPRGGCAPTFALVPTKLVGFNVDGGPAWSAPRPLVDVYQPSHRYAYPAVVGAGRPLRARCMDPRVWDNYGKFKVTIRRPG